MSAAAVLGPAQMLSLVEILDDTQVKMAPRMAAVLRAPGNFAVFRMFY